MYRMGDVRHVQNHKDMYRKKIVTIILDVAMLL